MGGCHVKGCLPPRRGRPTYRPAGKLATTPRKRSYLRSQIAYALFLFRFFQMLMLDIRRWKFDTDTRFSPDVPYAIFSAPLQGLFQRGEKSDRSPS